MTARHDPKLPLERRARLARETVGLIRWLADSLVETAEEARLSCEDGGNPQPLADEIATIAEQAQRLRGQVEQISRGFVVLDRLIPPAAPAADMVAPDIPAPPAYAPPPHAEAPVADPAAPVSPPPPAGLARRAGGRRASADSEAHDETRDAAAAFAVGLKLEGATRDEVEARLIGEFDRRDARELADEAFGR
jgi:hypothetical protein